MSKRLKIAILRAQGYSQAEIGELLGLSQKAVSWQLQKIRNRANKVVALQVKHTKDKSKLLNLCMSILKTVSEI